MRRHLDIVKQKYGFIPNVLAEMAEAPNVLKAYLDLWGSTSAGTLSVTEQQIVQITTSRIGGCYYCVAAHSTMGDMHKLSSEVVDAVREGKPITDKKLEALRQFAEAVVNKQGWATDADVSAFLAAGYTKAQVFEVVISVVQKNITSYVNHIADTPLDQVFQRRAINLDHQRKAG